MINSARSNPFWLVAAYDASLSQNMPGGPEAAPDPDAKALEAAMTGVKAIGLWGAVENDQVRINFALKCRDAANASQVNGSMQKMWDKETKGIVAAAKITAALIFLPEPARNVVREIMTNTKFSAQDDLAQVATLAGLPGIKNAIQGLQNMTGGIVGGAPLGNPARPGPAPGFTPPGGLPNDPGAGTRGRN
jgi:hypothetical protein